MPGSTSTGLPCSTITSLPRKRKITVAYIPVTCQLTCPVTDYISKFSESGEMFLPRMFQGFPEIKEALISNKMQAAFIVAPMAIALAAQGVPIKVVYLGHRYGSAVVVRKRWPGQELLPSCAGKPSPFPAASPTSGSCSSAR